MRLTYLLIGNYGVGNLGDEALKEYFLTAFPEVEWRVVSRRPGDRELHPLPCGFRSLFSPWYTTIRALRTSDGVVFGGGSLFTDTESPFACFLWWVHAAAARFFGKRTYFAFQGVGPFRTRIGERLARNAFASATFVSVRDPLSLARVLSWNLNTKIIQSFDPVFSLFKNKKSSYHPQNVFTIIPRYNSSKTLLDEALNCVGSHAYASVHIVSMQPDDLEERLICESLQLRFGDSADIIAVRTLPELQTAIAHSALVLTERYHGAIAALGLGIPLRIIMQKRGDKLGALQELMEQADDQESLRATLAEHVSAGEELLRTSLLVSM